MEVDEQLFRVNGSRATAAVAVSLEQAGLKERADLQEWVIAHPEMIGPDVRIITFEFGRWTTADGNRNADRLDVLGMDTDGTLVVVELKRGRAPDTVEMQAIKYAAMASRFTLESLAETQAQHLSTQDKTITADQALELLTSHAPDLSTDTLRTPRIVLMAREFPPSVTASCVWLTEMGLDITLVTFQAYQSGEQTLVTVSQLFPVPDIEDFTITPRQAEVSKAKEKKKRTQAVAATRRLIDAGIITNGTEFALQTPGVHVDLLEQINDYVNADPDRKQATWSDEYPSTPLTWSADGQRYSPSGLAGHIFEEATGDKRAIQGTLWWVDVDGDTLADLANSLQTGIRNQYLSFWTQFLDRLQVQHPNWSAATQPQQNNWMNIPGPLSWTPFDFSFARGNRLRCDLYIDAGNRDTNKQLFDYLFAHQADIEQRCMRELEWERLDDKRACRVSSYRPGSIVDESEWPEYVQWFLDTCESLQQALPDLSTWQPE